MPNLIFVGPTDIAVVTGPRFVTEIKTRDLKLAFRERGLNELTFPTWLIANCLAFPEVGWCLQRPSSSVTRWDLAASFAFPYQ
jgi:hypothetical protein